MAKKHMLGAALCGAAVVAMVLVGASGAGAAPTLPDFGAATFVPGAPIDNPFYPLTPGTLYIFEGEVDDDGDTLVEHVEVFVTRETRDVAGVSCVVVRDTVWLDGKVEERTDDWYAQDTVGNVWYMGEWSTAFEYDDEGELIGTNHDGSWETGVDGALPGYIMEANPLVGDSYYQEYYVGEAEDEAEVTSLSESVSVEYDDYDDCIQILESSALIADARAYKYYAAGIGVVLEEELVPIVEPGGVALAQLNGEFEVDFTLELIDIQQVPIPEPATWSLLLVGVSAMARRRRRT